MVKIGRVPGCKIKTDQYIGDGAASQAITGIGFRPKFATVMPHTDDTYTCMALYKTDQDGTKTYFTYVPGTRSRYWDDFIISLDADGFAVGDGDIFGNVLNTLNAEYSFMVLG